MVSEHSILSSEVAMTDAEKESEARCKEMLNQLISVVKKQTLEMENLAGRMNEIAIGLKAVIQPLGPPVRALPPPVSAPTATLVTAVDHAVAAVAPHAKAALAPESPTKCSTSGPDTNAGDIQVVAESEPEKGVPTVAPALTEHSSAPSPKLFSTIKQDTVTPTRCSTACRSCNTEVAITRHAPSIGADVDRTEAEATPCTDSIRATVMLANCSMSRRLYEQGDLKAWFRELPGGILDSLPTEEVMQCSSEDDCAQLCTKLDDEMPRKWFDYYQGGVPWMPPWPPPQEHETLLESFHKQAGIRSTMRLVKHPNVLQLFEVRASKSKIYFVLEYAKGGVLFNKIAKGGKLSEDATRRYFHQLISAVDYCHSRGVYYRDLKPENLLLDENENLKVSDFGLSALAESKRQDGLLHTTCGTPIYVAPEVLSRKGHDGTKADIWSCGVILFVLVADYLPFHDTNLMEMYRKISKADFRCPRYFSAELKEPLHKILDSDPSTRISISRIKRSAWYRRLVEVNAKKNETETTGNTCSGEATTSGSTECSTSEGNQGTLSIPNLNAFDIISLSTGFNLSGFFEDKYGRREERFTTRQPVTTVLTKLKELGKRLKLKVKKKENGVLELAAPKEGKKGFLELDAEIFEVAPSFLLVELKKTNGDTMEYQKLVKEEIRPALKDIVWVWQGDQHQHSQPILQGEQQQSPLPPQQPLDQLPPQQPQDQLPPQQPQDQLQPSLPRQEPQDMSEPPLPPQELQDQLQPPIPPDHLKS